MKNRLVNFFFIFSILPNLVFANDEILNNLISLAKNANPQFVEFSSSEGEKLFKLERINAKGEKISCTSCHTKDPHNEGKTRANKIIQPIAPVANPERFTDIAKVEKWFKRNCKDVLDRECTVIEKGNFTKFMMSIK